MVSDHWSHNCFSVVLALIVGANCSTSCWRSRWRIDRKERKERNVENGFLNDHWSVWNCLFTFSSFYCFLIVFWSKCYRKMEKHINFGRCIEREIPLKDHSSLGIAIEKKRRLKEFESKREENHVENDLGKAFPIKRWHEIWRKRREYEEKTWNMKKW